MVLSLGSIGSLLIAQPTVTQIRYINTSQNILIVTFDQPIDVFTNNTGTWTVTFDGVATPTTLSVVGTFGTDVAVTITPSIVWVNTHLLPDGGAGVELSYDGTGTWSNSGTGAVAAFGPIQGINDRVVTCADFRTNVTSNVSTDGNCVPVTADWDLTYRMRDRARNSINFDPTLVDVEYDWGDGSPIETINAPETAPGTADFQAMNSHVYVPALVCLNSAQAQPLYNSVLCGGGSLTQTNDFVAWNTDDMNGGMVVLDPVQVDICLGTDTAGLFFDDITTFNCDAATAMAASNQELRQVLFVYGDPATGDANRIPSVSVDGIQVTDNNGTLISAGGYEDTRGVITYPAQVFPAVQTPTAQSLEVSFISGNEVVGDIFVIRLLNWNTCNPYPGFYPNNEIEATAQLEIITNPAAPTANNVQACVGDATPLADVSINPLGGATLINWYDADPFAGPANLLQSQAPAGGNSYTHGILTAVPSVTTFYATQVVGGVNACESFAVPVTVTVYDSPTPAAAGPG